LTNLYVENPKVIVTSTDLIYTVLSLTLSRGQCRLYLFIQQFLMCNYDPEKEMNEENTCT